MKNLKKVLVVGATGGTGIATIKQLLSKGFTVTALARKPEKLIEFGDSINVIKGDIFNARSLEKAMKSQEAVVVSLGISENPIRVRVLGPKWTPLNVRSAGTERVIAAMKKEGVAKLIVQSSFGVGESRDKLRFIDSLFFKVLLKPQITDTELQESIVKKSGLQWVLAQPVHLRNDTKEEVVFASVDGETRKPSINRRSVAQFLSEAIGTDLYTHRSVALSAA